MSRRGGARDHMGSVEAVRGETLDDPLVGTHRTAGDHFLMFALAHAAETTWAVSAAITALEAQNGRCREEGRGEGYVEYWYMNIKKKSSRGYS